MYLFRGSQRDASAPLIHVLKFISQYHYWQACANFYGSRLLALPSVCGVAV